MTFAIKSLTLVVVSNGGIADADGCEEHETLIKTTSGASHNRLYIARNLNQLVLKTQFPSRRGPGARQTTPPCRCAASGAR